MVNKCSCGHPYGSDFIKRSDVQESLTGIMMRMEECPVCGSSTIIPDDRLSMLRFIIRKGVGPNKLRPNSKQQQELEDFIKKHDNLNSTASQMINNMRHNCKFDPTIDEILLITINKWRKYNE